MGGLDQNFGWSASAMQYYNECMQNGGNALSCETATNNYMIGGGGGFLENTAPQLVDLIGQLGLTGAGIYGAFTGQPVQQQNGQPGQTQTPTKNNTTLYIIVGIVVLIILFFIIKMMKK